VSSFEIILVKIVASNLEFSQKKSMNFEDGKKIKNLIPEAVRCFLKKNHGLQQQPPEYRTVILF
jgi:hypothetical protein